MRWILAFCFVLFLILRSKANPPYEKYYSDTGFLNESFTARFATYLDNLRDEIKTRFNPMLMSWREPGSTHFYPDAPANWKQALTSRRTRFVRVVGDASFMLFGFVLVDAIRGAYIHRPWGNIPVMDVFLLFTVLPPLLWLARRHRVDGLTQGYLNGYMDGYSKGYLDAKVEDGKIETVEE